MQEKSFMTLYGFCKPKSNYHFIFWQKKTSLLRDNLYFDGAGINYE